MKNLVLLIVIASLFVLPSCCKDKKDKLCNSDSVSINPFLEKYYTFTCGGNLYEYQYVMRRKSQIDSLTDCTFSPPVPFPVDETDFVYIMFGKMSYYYKDTFQTALFIDTCLKKLTYQVDMVQRFKTLESNGGGVRSMFCAVENIPADYQVEVKYKYVPLPE